MILVLTAVPVVIKSLLTIRQLVAPVNTETGTSQSRAVSVPQLNTFSTKRTLSALIRIGASMLSAPLRLNFKPFTVTLASFRAHEEVVVVPENVNAGIRPEPNGAHPIICVPATKLSSIVVVDTVSV